MSSLPPGTVLLLGALVLPLLRGRWLKIVSIALPIASFAHLLFSFPTGHHVAAKLFDYSLIPVRVDQLSLVWGYVFHLAAILAAIYGMHVRSRVHHCCAAAYVGSAIGAVFAGDLLTLFLFWEITAVASVFLVWEGTQREAVGAGLRYALFHIASGVLILAGAVMVVIESGSLEFGAINAVGVFHEMKGWGPSLLFLGIGIKAAFPLVHTWLPDAYSNATPAGAVFLSAFTTKMAVYALARGFAGSESLVVIGAMMCVFPLLHALLADDLRRTLAHVLNNQLGFMVVAVGIGTPLAINGAAAMAFAHVIYKGLLFMAMGAVLMQTGSTKQSQLGGLGKTMPWTCVFCLIAAWSVFPLNCGFVTKSLVLSAVANAHHETVWILLITGAIGAFLVVGIKVPYFAFFARSTHSRKAEEAPPHMLIAMGISSMLCLGIGIYPDGLYRLLPFDQDYHPYTLSHLVQQLQLMSCTVLVFGLLLRLGLYPQPVQGTLLDVDWFYRSPWRRITDWMGKEHQAPTASRWSHHVERMVSWLQQQCCESGYLGRSVSTNTMAISAMILLAIYLLVYF